MRYLTNNDPDFSEWIMRVALHERSFRYPLGDDYFSICHGEDYLEFFRRMGEPHYMIAEERGRLAGMACGVLRQMKGKSCWYLCDLKVSRQYQGNGLPGELFLKASIRRGRLSQSVYAISMNPKEGENPMGRLLRRFPLYRLHGCGQLNVYQVDVSMLGPVMGALQQSGLACQGWLSNRGVKDIVLESTGEPVPLYHLQFGEWADGQADQQVDEEGTYMFCAWQGGGLARRIEQLGIQASASATVFSHGVSREDIGNILTSDI